MNEFFCTKTVHIVVQMLNYKSTAQLPGGMLDSQTINKIENYVMSQPRSVHEIARMLGKNWRTADRYVYEIAKSFGTLSVKVFRGGTRGALKIVFWAGNERISKTVFQEMLEEDILRSRKKEDFSAFNIFQHVSDNEKKAIICASETNPRQLTELKDMLLSSEKQVLVFSGNLSFINNRSESLDFLYIFESIVKRNISVKIICRVDFAGKANVEELLSLNFKHGRELVEIRHCEHPLRAFIIDGKMFRMKEVKEPTGKMNELNKKAFLFYTIKSKEWSEWLSRIFWKMFNRSIDANKRLAELNKIKISYSIR